MHPRSDPTAALLTLARLQQGVVTLEQAAGHGLNRNSVARLVREERWSSLGRGLYCVSAGPPSWLGLAWGGVLVAGDSSRLGGLAAAHLHDLVDDPPTVLDVWTSRKRDSSHPWRFRREGPRTHTARGVGAPPRLTVEDTVLDLTHELHPDELTDLLLRTVQTRRSSPRRLREAASQRLVLPQRRLVQDLLAEAGSGVESTLERRYRHDVELAHGLPRATRQLRQRGLRRDVVYEEHGLLVELDGRFHEGAGRFRDMARDNSAMLTGQRTLRFGWPDVTAGPCRAAAQVAHLLVLGGWDGVPRRCPRCRQVPRLEDLAA